MSYDAQILEREAALTADPRAARMMRWVASRLRARWTVHEEELISRLVVLVVVADDLHVELLVDVEVAVAVWAEESGGYALARRANADGSNDLGALQENSIHGRTDIRLSRVESVRFWRDVLAPRRLRRGHHPLADYNAFTSGRWVGKRRYAAEAVRRARKPHPTAWP